MELKDLETASFQEIINFSGNFILNQEEKSFGLDDDGVESEVYFDDNGNKCAIGCFFTNKIQEELLDNNMQHAHIRLIINHYGLVVDSCKLEVLDKLRIIHDCKPKEQWESSLKRLAKIYKTKFKRI